MTIAVTDPLPYAFDANDASPDWGAAGKVHDWRNHVGPNAKYIWAALTPAIRTALAIDADILASQEEWD